MDEPRIRDQVSFQGRWVPMCRLVPEVPSERDSGPRRASCAICGMSRDLHYETDGVFPEFTPIGLGRLVDRSDGVFP